MKTIELETVQMVARRIEHLKSQIKGFKNITDEDAIYIAGYLDALNHLKSDLNLLDELAMKNESE